MRPPGMMAHTCNLNTWEAEVGGGPDETGSHGENNRVGMYYIS